jgi:hypothetical protein
MTKNNAKYLEVMTLMLTVALAPALSAYAQTTDDSSNANTSANTETNAVTTDAQSDTDDQKRKDKQRGELKRIKEKISEKSDRQDKVAKVREKTDRKADMARHADKLVDLTYEGKANGYAILGGQAFVSSIGLSGKGHHLNGGNWEITAIGDISVADKGAKLDLRGHVRGNLIALKGTGTLSDGATIDIHLKGHYAPIQGNEYAIAFTNSHIQYKDSGTRMPLMLVGSATVTPTTQPISEPVNPAQ